MRVEAKFIYDCLNLAKKKDERFKCVLLINACFSGKFYKLNENLCCETLITSSDDSHVTRSQLLVRAFNELLSNSSDNFTPIQIYSNAKDDDSTDWNKKSLTVQMASCWDFSELDSKFNPNLSKNMVKECSPVIFGNKEILLTPVIDSFTMTEIIKNTVEKNQALTSENLYSNLLEITKKKYTFEQFYASMTLRQFKYNCRIKPSN